jgi:ParB/RepB/Spo0J family partition protein
MQIEYLDPKILKVPDVRVTNYFREEDRAEFLVSVRETGVREPVLVIQENGSYYVVDGFNRAMAAVEVGLATIPCVVKPGTVRDVLLENLQTATQRGTYKFSEVRKVIEVLENEEHLDSDEICRATGMSRERVENLMWVNRAIPDVQESLDAGEIPLGHSVVIARFGEPDDQATMFALWAQYRPKLALFNAMADAHREHRASSPPAGPTGADATDPQQRNMAACGGCESLTPLTDLRPFMLCPRCYGVAWAAARSADGGGEP